MEFTKSEQSMAKLLLFEWRDIVVPRTDYWFLHDTEDEPTWFQVFLDKGSTVSVRD
jgi:hypothetical protein